MSAQQSLPLAWTPRYDAHSFIVSECNRAAFDRIARPAEWVAPVTIILGPKGSGKTHLAHMFREWHGAVSDTVDHDAKLYVIDDADRGAVSDEALFHLYNHVMATEGLRLALIMTEAPDAWVKLPDLLSRLRACGLERLGMPDEEMIKAAYRKLFSDRGLLVDDKVLDYITLRTERSFLAVLAVTDALDSASLTIKRRITIPFVQGLGLFA